MLTQTKVLRRLEVKLGYKFSELEIDDNEIISIILSETLPEFSKKFPYRYRKILTDKDRDPEFENIFFLNSEDENEEIVVENVANVYVYYNTTGTAYINPNMNDGINSIFNSMNRPPQNTTSFRFLPPDRVEIRPASMEYGNFLVELNIQHPDHLTTIGKGLESEFMQLALYDVQGALYQLRHRFANLQTAYGNIELFIDDLQNSFDKREDLIEKWRTKQHLTSNRKKIWKA